MKILYTYCLLLFVISCRNSTEDIKKTNESTDYVAKSDTLEEDFSDIIKNIRQDKDTVAFLDLSKKGLKNLPDLSMYNVKKIDISFNDLDTIDTKKLPKGLLYLNASHNKVKRFGIFYSNKRYGLKNNSELNLLELDLSYNKLVSAYIYIDDKQCRLQKINLSNNDLRDLKFSCNSIQSLDISNNINFSNTVEFDINIDTIVRQNIANKLPLKKKDYPKMMPPPIR